MRWGITLSWPKKKHNCTVWVKFLWKRVWIFWISYNSLKFLKNSDCDKESLSNVRPLKLGHFVFFWMLLGFQGISLFFNTIFFHYYWQGHLTLMSKEIASFKLLNSRGLMKKWVVNGKKWAFPLVPSFFFFINLAIWE